MPEASRDSSPRTFGKNMIIESVVSAALTSGALLWLTKTWLSERLKSSIQHEYCQQLETFKARLKSESDVSLERLRADLQIASARRNIEYNRIHEKRLEIISELSGKIADLQQAAASYTSIFEWDDGPTKEERRKTFAEEFGSFNKYFRPRRLFLPSTLAKKIEEFRTGLYRISIDFMIHVAQGREDRTDPGKQTDKWSEASSLSDLEK
jgi:hypothetical protein